jgi:hypothetical protein
MGGENSKAKKKDLTELTEAEITLLLANTSFTREGKISKNL